MMKFRELEVSMASEVVSLFYTTFFDSEGETEAKIVSGLVEKYMRNYPREDLQGYVGLSENELVGAVFFSQLLFPEGDLSVVLLSPMAVKTGYHGQGIGQRLIQYAHDELRKSQVNLSMTYGDINFYSKVGYEHVAVSDIAAPHKLSYPQGWLGTRLDGVSPLRVAGPSKCVPELDDQQLW